MGNLNAIGELCSILSALAWAIGIMLYRQLGATLPPLRLNFLKNLLVFGMILPAIPLAHGLALPHFGAAQLAAAIVSGMVGIGLADTLYFRALNELGAGRMGVLGNFYSPFVIVLSYAFLGERLTAWQLLGFALVSIGVWVAAWPRALQAEGQAQPAHTMRGLGFALLAIVLMAGSIVLVKRVLEAQPLLWVTSMRARPWRTPPPASDHGRRALAEAGCRRLRRAVPGDGAVAGRLQVLAGLGRVGARRDGLGVHPSAGCRVAQGAAHAPGAVRRGADLRGRVLHAPSAMKRTGRARGNC
jgi:uncharacterized membrane protein